MRNWFSHRSQGLAASGSMPVPSPRTRTLAADCLHVVVLTSLAVAQPIYDRLGARSAFLIDQSITPATVGLLIFLVSFGMPAVIVLFEIIVARGSRTAGDALHSAIVGVLLVLLALPVFSRIAFLPAPAMICAALAAGCIGHRCYFAFRNVRAVATVAAPGILIFPAVFLAQFSAATAEIAPSGSVSARWEPVPVVVLVFDEFCGLTLMTPEREIDARRFPNFADLSRRSTWFRNAASVDPFTEQALPAILSGKYATSRLPPGPADRPQNLFSALQLAGDYELAAFEPVSNLAPKRANGAGTRQPGPWQQTSFLAGILWRVYLFHITPADYHDRLPPIPRVWFGMRDSLGEDHTQHRGVFRYGWRNRRDVQFQHFLECLDGSSRPTLYFLHALLPHVPWSYLPSGQRYAEDSSVVDLLPLDVAHEGDEVSGHDEFSVTQIQQRYLLQLMYVDHLIGSLLSRLTETGLLDRCLLIVTADHGVSFRAGQPRRNLVPGNQDEILSIPLFIKLPKQTQGQISDRAVESVDILPTIADVIGMTLHSPTDGWSVYDASHPERKHLTNSSFPFGTTVDPTLIRNSETPAVLRHRFGNGTDPQALFRIGPIPELVGQSVQRLPKSTDEPIEIKLLRYGNVVSGAPDVALPCYYEGILPSHKPTEAPVVLAIAINGTIRAVTRTYRQTGFQNRWTAMVPEESFHAGENEVKFFAVTGTGPAWRLTPCVARRPEN